MTNTTKIRLIVIAVVIAILVPVLYYFATHGRLNITNPGDKQVSLVSIEGNETSQEQAVSNGSLVTSGTYIVRNDQNGTLRLANISVPGWLRSASVTFMDTKTAQMDRVASLTYDNFIPADNGSLVSFTSLGNRAPGFKAHVTDDAFGGKSADSRFASDILSPTPTSDGKLLGIYQADISTYSFVTGQFQKIATAPIADTEGTDEDLALQRSSGTTSSRVGYSQAETGKLTVINTANNSTETVNLPDGHTKVFDVNDNGWANVTSKNPEGEASEDTFASYQLVVGKFGSNDTKTLDIGANRNVDSVALSPDSKYAGVVKNDQLWVYDIENSSVVMVNPFTAAQQMFWNGDKLYSLTVDSGVTVFDSTQKQISAITVSNPEGLSFSSMTPVGSKLYVTAFNTKHASRLADGFVIDLEKNSDGITNQLAKSLPIEKQGYKANYLGNKIYVRVNDYGLTADAVARIKLKATDDLKKALGDTYGKCEVVFED